MGEAGQTDIREKLTSRGTPGQQSGREQILFCIVNNIQLRYLNDGKRDCDVTFIISTSHLLMGFQLTVAVVFI